MHDLLVTGTDTGVGKTVVAAALVMALRHRGVRAIGFKPAETGLVCDTPSDSTILARAAGEDVAFAAPLLQLSDPLAPAVAADRAGVRLDPEEIESRIRALRDAGYLPIVEGAGGLLVPLAWGYTVLDLAERMGLEAIVVGRAGLGTLNHVALTVAMLRGRGVPVRAIVLNGRQASADLAETTNPGALARLLPGIPIAVIPQHAGADPVASSVPFLQAMLSASGSGIQ